MNHDNNRGTPSSGHRLDASGKISPPCGGVALAGLRISQDMERGAPVQLTFNGQPLLAYEGETIAAAIMAGGERRLRTTERRGQPRGLFCNMGICFDCLVQVDGRPNRRACQTVVADGMNVASQDGPGSWGPLG